MFSKEERIDELTKIILICKRYYNRDKYSTTLEALKQYYKVNYGFVDIYEEQLETNPEPFLLRNVLRPAMQTLIEEYPDRTYSFINGYILNKPQFCLDVDLYYNNYQVALYYRIVNFFKNLPMSGQNYKEINTDKYLEWQGEDGWKLIKDIVK